MTNIDGIIVAWNWSSFLIFVCLFVFVLLCCCFVIVNIMFLLGTAEKQFLELMQLPTNIKTTIVHTN